MSGRVVEALREDLDARIDAALAQRQHASYVEALRALGIAVEEIGEAETHADGCFVEDTAVVLSHAFAVLTVPGAASRRPETAEVLPALERMCEIERMAGDATLDGGDVLRVGDRLFVGLSSRTNLAGAEALGRAAGREGVSVTTIILREGLHLKSACSLVDPTTLLVASTLSSEGRAALASSGCELLDAPEAIGANVLSLGGTTLVSAAAPETAALLRGRGRQVVELDLSELHKADGALTCLSLRVPPPDHWCA